MKIQALMCLVSALWLLPIEQAGATDVLGQVVDKQTGTPLSGVSVMIVETGDSTATDGSGNYTILNVPVGSYTFVVGTSDYQPYSSYPIFVGSCCHVDRGNINGDPKDRIDISDLTYMVDFLFTGGSAPPCLQEGNFNGDPAEHIDISDLTDIVDYLFNNGPGPAACP